MNTFRLTRFATGLIFVLISSCTINNPTLTKVTSDPSHFIVARPLIYSANDGEYEIVVPRGFITDLASIPSPLWWWEAPHESTAAPAILHDYLYWHQICTKEEADAVMYLAMLEIDVDGSVRNAVYLGIRTNTAQEAWDDNKDQVLGGSTRFLTNEFVNKMQDRPIDGDLDLAGLLALAIEDDGLIFPSKQDSKLKSACTAALQQFHKVY